MKRVALMLALLALGLATGCAGWVEPQVPLEFKGRKVKEDPPLIRHVAPPSQAQA